MEGERARVWERRSRPRRRLVGGKSVITACIGCSTLSTRWLPFLGSVERARGDVARVDRAGHERAGRVGRAARGSACAPRDAFRLEGGGGGVRGGDRVDGRIVGSGANRRRAAPRSVSGGRVPAFDRRGAPRRRPRPRDARRPPRASGRGPLLRRGGGRRARQVRVGHGAMRLLRRRLVGGLAPLPPLHHGVPSPPLPRPPLPRRPPRVFHPRRDGRGVLLPAGARVGSPMAPLPGRRGRHSPRPRQRRPRRLRFTRRLLRRRGRPPGRYPRRRRDGHGRHRRRRLRGTLRQRIRRRRRRRRRRSVQSPTRAVPLRRRRVPRRPHRALRRRQRRSSRQVGGGRLTRLLRRVRRRDVGRGRARKKGKKGGRRAGRGRRERGEGRDGGGDRDGRKGSVRGIVVRDGEERRGRRQERRGRVGGLVVRRAVGRASRFAVLFARGGVARVSRSRRDTPRAIVGGSRSRPRFFSRLWRCVAAPPFRARTRVGGIDFTRRQTPR